MTQVELADLLAAVVKLAQRAGDAILSVYSKQFEVTQKSDQSPLTLADLRSHEIITQGLRELTPELPVLSEEASDIPYEQRAKWTRYWLVDPLDGTKSFIRREGEFTVNIALIEHGKPVAGIIDIPVARETYYGVVGKGAWRLHDGGAAEKISTREPDGSGYAAVVSMSHLDPKTSAFLAPLSVTERVSASSSLKFCRVAEGIADIYPRFGPTMEWDTAAGHAIVEAAGGRVETPDGEPFRYHKPDFRNGPFIVWGR